MRVIALIPDPLAWFTRTAVLYFSDHESKAVRASFPEDYWLECRKCKINQKSVFLSMEEKVLNLSAWVFLYPKSQNYTVLH